MTINEVQELVEAWSEKNSIRSNELTNIALLTEEIGKLAKVMARRHGEHDPLPEIKEEISLEIGNIFWTLTNIANQTGINLTEALADSLARKSIHTKK